MPNDLAQIGRLALRQEGDWWEAYYALPDSMADAIPLGRIRMAIAAIPERKAGFMALMREVVADLIEEKTGMRPTWKEPYAAPEHERAGQA